MVQNNDLHRETFPFFPKQQATSNSNCRACDINKENKKVASKLPRQEGFSPMVAYGIFPRSTSGTAFVIDNNKE